MPLFGNALAGAAGQGGDVEANIINSLRFNSADTAWLNKTFSSAGNRRTFTFACWLKRTKLGGRQTLLRTNSSELHFSFAESAQGNEDAFFCYGAGGSPYLVSDAVFKDVAGWYHFCIVWDTTESTATDRLKLYVNGVRITSWKTSTFPNQNYEGGLNSATAHGLGANSSGGERFDGYMADVYFIDGTAHDPTSFGAFDDSGVWQPAGFSGAFGSNGFHLLDFANESTIGHDSSGNNFDWSNNNFTAIDGIVESTSNFSGSGTNYGSISAILDNNTATGYGAQAGTVTYTPASAITVSSQIKFWYSTDQSNTRFRVNNGSYITLSDPNGVGTYTHSFSGSLTKIEWNAPTSGELISVHHIEIDSKPLVSTAALAGNDIVYDVPMNGDQSDTGAGGEVSGNYAILNHLHSVFISPTDGNLKIVGTNTSTYAKSVSTIWIDPEDTTGYYCEFTCLTVGSNPGGHIQLVPQVNLTNNGKGETGGVGLGMRGSSAGNRWYKLTDQSSSTDTGVSHGANQVIGVAVKNGKLYMAINNTWVLSGNPATESNPLYSSLSGLKGILCGTLDGSWQCNFGQHPFAYSAPSGYRPISSVSLPTPAISDGSGHFDPILYTGNGGTQTISGLEFSPDLVWIKKRSAQSSHHWTDTVRGTQKTISSNYNGQENWAGGGSALGELTAFTSDGFTLVNSGSYGFNDSSAPYVAWCWNAASSTASNTDGNITSSVRANQTAGFSIVKFTGPSSAGFQSVGHGLGKKPEFVICKDLDNDRNWSAYHKDSQISDVRVVPFNQNVAPFNSGTATWDISEFSTTTFTPYFRDDYGASYSADNIAYCFAPVAGFSAFGSYEGNGSTSQGPFIYTGFAPAFLIFRRYSDAGDWIIFDNKRNTYPGNYREKVLYAHGPNAEETAANGDTHLFLSNGFAIDNVNFGYWNASGHDYLWAAFAENPFQANGGLAR
jgi:hypothetical protein